MKPPQLLFSDYFGISKSALDEYGALNICLEADLPLFIDPFLLFASEKEEYQTLHNIIVAHLISLKQLAASGNTSDLHLFQFPEVPQNWLGVSRWGNKGRGLGPQFASNLIAAFNGFYSNFGEESITDSAHIEKLTLVGKGIGKDFISDFTTNLIQEFLLEYTQTFARIYLQPHQRKEFSVRCSFSETLQVWLPKTFELPFFFQDDREDDYVILTPVDILTKDDAFICHSDFTSSFRRITSALENSSLREAINAYFTRHLPTNPKKADYENAINTTVLRFPELLDYYIRSKEDKRDQASPISLDRVEKLKRELLDTLQLLSEALSHNGDFYQIIPNSYDEALKRAHFLKETIENNDIYRIFYKDGKPIASEETIQRIFRLTWFGSPFDVNSEVNNGRGPADYKVSYGQRNSTIVEFKLGNSTSLKANLLNQTQIYKKASRSIRDIKVILCYTQSEIRSVNRILASINQENAENIVVIDATPKISASKARANG
jgi:hypothetical protein